MVQDNYLIIYLSGNSSRIIHFNLINLINKDNINSIDINEYGVNFDTKYIISKINECNKLIFMIPEFNGSYPGVLKTLIDNLSIDIWKDKKAFIIGYSGGYSGNIKGVSHLTDVLNHLKIHVHYNKLHIPNIKDNCNDVGGIPMIANEYQIRLEEYIKEFISY